MAETRLIVPSVKNTRRSQFPSSLGIFSSNKSFFYDKLPSQPLRLSVLKLDASSFGKLLLLLLLEIDAMQEWVCLLLELYLQIFKFQRQQLLLNLRMRWRPSLVTCLRRDRQKFHGLCLLTRYFFLVFPFQEFHLNKKIHNDYVHGHITIGSIVWIVWK